MNVVRSLKFLSLPAAVGLGTALVIACTDGGPTGPEQALTPVGVAQPFAAPKKQGGGGKDTVVDDVNLTCQNNYVLTAETTSTAFADINLNDQVCVYSHSAGGGPKKH